MNEEEQYMADFMTVFETLERWGPGSDSDTLHALSYLPQQPQKILEIGCGKGITTRLLAKNSSADIIAVDNEQSALDDLSIYLEREGLTSRVTPYLASMTELPFEDASFDLICAEGSAYIMGVTNAIEH